MTTTTATTLPRARAGRSRSGFVSLARIELARLARHPALLVGLVLGVVITALTVDEMARNRSTQVTGDVLGMPVTALTVGLSAMISSHLLARSFDQADDLLESVPTSRTTRTAALCASTLLPAGLAGAWLVLFGLAEGRLWTTPDWIAGTLSRADVWAIIIGHTVVAAVGGTLLGIASARWWHFRGSTVALVLGVTIWTFGVIGFFSGEGTPAEWYRWVRLFSPVNSFSNPAPGGGYEVGAADTLTGSPWWYLAWLVTLCSLAGIAALLKGSEGPARRRLVRLGAAALIVSALTYGLAAAGGNSHSVRTYSDGHRVVLIP